MSDQETNNNTPGKTEPDPAAPGPAAKSSPLPSSAVAWLALLLVVALAGGGAWLFTQMQRAESALAQRIDELASRVGRDQGQLDALDAGLRQELQSRVGSLAAEVSGNSAQLTDSVLALEAQLEEQRAQLARFGAADRSSWLLAEVEYLLRLANQRLIMAGDTVAAQALLESADNVLREMEDVGLVAVRGAVAADLAALRAVPRLDVEGMYLRLAALIEQADRLVIFRMPAQEPRQALKPADHWRERLRQGYQQALQALSDYIVIRRRDVPMQALMDPQWESLVRQNLRMLLEQSQVALLSGNQVLYGESLERARHWVAQFSDSDPAGAGAMAAEIDQLTALKVAAPMPDISRSLRALDEAMEQRHGSQGGG